MKSVHRNDWKFEKIQVAMKISKWSEFLGRVLSTDRARFSNKITGDVLLTLRAESIVFVSMLSSSSGPRSVLLGGTHDIHGNHKNYENYENYEKHENHENYENYENIEYMEKVRR